MEKSNNNKPHIIITLSDNFFPQTVKNATDLFKYFNPHTAVGVIRDSQTITEQNLNDANHG
jgi:hypothetical protein